MALEAVSRLLWQPPGRGTILLGGREGGLGRPQSGGVVMDRWEKHLAGGEWRDGLPGAGRSREQSHDLFGGWCQRGPRVGEKAGRAQKGRSLKGLLFLAKGGRSGPSGLGAEPVSRFRAQRTPEEGNTASALASGCTRGGSPTLPCPLVPPAPCPQ